MPNAQNITRPITLVGTGRSGTTLLTNVFRSHPDFESLGETANIIYPSFYHAEKNLPFCAPYITKDNAAEMAVLSVRSSLQALFQSEKVHWFHKPIMLPRVTGFFSSHENFAEWYWNTSKLLFPDSYIICVLRKPADVIHSYMKRWNQSQELATRNYIDTYKLLVSEHATVSDAILFEDLTQDSEKTVKQLFSNIGVSESERSLEAFDTIHAPNSTNGVKESIETLVARNYTQGLESTLDPAADKIYQFAVERYTPTCSSDTERSIAI